MRIHVESRENIHITDALLSLLKREVASFNVSGYVIVIVYIQLCGSIQSDSAFRPGSKFCQASELTDVEVCFEVKRSVTLRILERTACIHVRIAQRQSKARDPDRVASHGGVRVDLRRGRQIWRIEI